MNEKNLLRIGYKAMIRKKKWRSDFPLGRAAKDHAHVLETQIPVGHAINFPFYEGLYTLKNDRLPSNQDIDNSVFVSVVKRVDGFLEATGTKRIDLTSKRRKIVKAISSSYYHFFADDVCDIIYALNLYPDAELILDVSQVAKSLSEPNRGFLNFFFSALEDKGIRYKLVDVSQFDIIYINDYYIAESIHKSSMSGPLFFNFFKEYIDNPNEKPYRNVYLTRKKVLKDVKDLKQKAAKLSFTTDDRVDSEERLGTIFESLGYEVVAPEDFTDFRHQINFFHSVKTLASLTSSGLANALFMQPGGTIVEFSTPLVVLSPILGAEKTIQDMLQDSEYDPQIAQELHMFYKLVAYLKSHTYISINNPNRSADDIEKAIYGNVKLFNFLDNNDKSNNL